MHSKTDKRRLYWLINQYLLEKISEAAFCDDFHDTLVNEMYYKGLTDVEYDVFVDLNDVSQRFTEYQEDFELWSGFVTATELKQKILEAQKKLE